MTTINVSFNGVHPNIIGVEIDKRFEDISLEDVAKTVKCEKGKIAGWALTR